MTRLSDRLVLQRVDAQLVLMDESAGLEVTAPATMETLMHTIDDVAAARADSLPGCYRFQGIDIPEDQLDRFLHAMGYLVTGALA